jgi:hypothetical protein
MKISFNNHINLVKYPFMVTIWHESFLIIVIMFVEIRFLLLIEFMMYQILRFKEV